MLLLRRGVWIGAAVVAIIACTLAITVLSSNVKRGGLPFTHKWRQTQLCRRYATQSGGHFQSGTSEPIRVETFFSERLGTCVQAQTFSPNDYSIVDLTNGYSQDTWLFICGPQGLYMTSFSQPIAGTSPSIPMLAPNGTVMMVPLEQSQAQIAAGAKLVVKMRDPEGTLRWIPKDQLHEALQAGGKFADEVPNGEWLEEGPRGGRPCEKLFNKTLAQIR